MSSIREFRDDDIEQVTRLHQQVFPPDSGTAPVEAYQEYFRDTFLRGPRPESSLRSLVCEGADGALEGFLGVVPLRMTFAGRSLWATVCTQFCVDPDRRGLAGLKLIRHHFAGPQDLSITDGANAVTMRLWRWAGGEPIISNSMHFLRPLRPARFALSALAERRPLAGVAQLALPARLTDLALAQLPHRYFRAPQPPVTVGEPLDAPTMVDLFADLTHERALAPLYEPEALAWYLRRAEAAPGGTLRRALVRDQQGSVLGWYLYHCGDGGAGTLLQLTAPAEHATPVIDHLVYDAWRAGITALKGRLDPALAQPLSDRNCMFSRRGPWMLVHSRDPEISASFHRGEALLSRLDGEWCARFTPPSA